MASPESGAPSPDPSDPDSPQPSSPADASPLWQVLLRDIAIVAAALSLFAAADSWHQLSGGLLSGTVALINGLLVGLGVAALVHEWGHFAGARLSGGTAPLRPFAGFLPIFDFDYANNTRQQFQAMSIGGNAGHWLVFLVFFFGFPLSSLGQVALASSAFGFGVFASSIEFPVIRHAAGGLSGLEALSKIPRDFVKRNGRYGLVAALVAFLVL